MPKSAPPISVTRHIGARAVARLFLNAALALVALFVVLFFFRVLTAPTKASASSNTLYPTTCLGGWDSVGLASGETTLANSAAPHEYADTNSAVLRPSVAAQLFCGDFPVEERTRDPFSVQVKLNWAFVAAPSDAPPNDASEPSLLGTTIIDSPNSTSSVTFIIPALEPTDPTESAPSESESSIIPEIPGIEITDPVPAPETPPAPQDTPVLPSPTDTPPPTPASDSPTSFIFENILALVTKTAYADEPVSGEIVRISYSLDGSTWTYGGSATAENWQQFAFSIPNPTWDELKKLQIKIEPVTSVDTRPTIYLDSIALDVSDTPTLAETIGDKLAVAGDLITSAIDSVNDLADAAVAAVTDDAIPSEVPQNFEQPAQVAAGAASAAPPAPLPKVRALVFSLAGNSVPSRVETPWQDKDIRDRLPDSATNVAPPDVRVTDGGRGLLVSGSCSDVYATVLAFRHADDYIRDPRTFVVNVALPCYQGHFSYNLEEMPLGVQDGEYYLLTGRQGATGSWIPASAVLPFNIRVIEIEPGQ